LHSDTSHRKYRHVPPAKPSRRASPASTERVAPAHLERVGAFVRRRREELGLSQAQVARTLGYKSVMSVSGIETGKEPLAPARAYAWAELLEVPRDALFLFVTGARDNMDLSGSAAGELTAEERELVGYHRKLPPRYRSQLLDVARALDALAREERKG
jgi:transcriptional regulator with XRE-family HTH domain